MQRERVRGQYALVISLTWYYDALETPHGGLEVRHLIYLSCYYIVLLSESLPRANIDTYDSTRVIQLDILACLFSGYSILGMHPSSQLRRVPLLLVR